MEHLLHRADGETKGVVFLAEPLKLQVAGHATDFYWVLGYTVVVVALALVLFKRKMLE